MNTARRSGGCPTSTGVTAPLRRIAFLAVATWALALLCTPTVDCVWADNSLAAQDLETKLSTPGSITLRDATLAEWMFAIQEMWHVDIVFGNELQSIAMNGSFGQTTLREILSTILAKADYGYERVGASLVIKTLQELGSLNPQFEDVILRYEYLDPAEAEQCVNAFRSETGMLQTVPSSKSIAVSDLPDRIARMRQRLQQLDENARLTQERQLSDERRATEQEQARLRAQPSLESSDDGPAVEIEAEAVHVFHPQYVQADALVDVMTSVLAGEGRATAMVEDNKLVVVARSSMIHAVEEMLRQIDVPRAQVRITALLYDVSVEEMERLGFNWSKAHRAGGFDNSETGSLLGLDNSNFVAPSGSSLGASTGGAGTGTGSGTGTGTGAAAAAVSSALGGWLTLSHISRHFDLTAIIQALSTTDGTRLLARPNILATDGSAAEFSAVSEIPVQQLTETAEGGAIGTTEFREAGIKLTVTPQIKQDGTIRLEVTPEFSVLAGFQDGQPIIDRRTATTVLQLQNGETVVIGGLLRRSDIENQRMLPGVRKWKYLSGLFRDHDTTITESELLVVVKAEIIGPTHIMRPRDEAVQGATEQLLEEIPYASHGAFVPPCGDPYCPLHHPHEAYKHYRGPECLQCTAGGQTNQYAVVPAGPPGDVYGPLPGALPVITAPADQPRAEPPRETLPSPLQERGDFAPDGNNEARARQDQPSSQPRWHLPPVMIDETARLQRDNHDRLALRRLPAVMPTAPAGSQSRRSRRLPATDSAGLAARMPHERQRDGLPQSDIGSRADPLRTVNRERPRSPRTGRRNWLNRIFGRY